jgi:hypothetical protein
LPDFIERTGRRPCIAVRHPSRLLKKSGIV